MPAIHYGQTKKLGWPTQGQFAIVVQVHLAGVARLLAIGCPDITGTV